mmetsp:Transcript_41575/g.131183  ORF Transcript_41575/g.131183 Transcript_41575/m.131183 type:complete len:212 (-) Transcript_41575:80-715(-)
MRPKCGRAETWPRRGRDAAALLERLLLLLVLLRNLGVLRVVRLRRRQQRLQRDECRPYGQRGLSDMARKAGDRELESWSWRGRAAARAARGPCASGAAAAARERLGSASRRPLVLEYVEADGAALRRDIGVPYPRAKLHLWRHEGVVTRQADVHDEYPALVRRPNRPLELSNPLEQVRLRDERGPHHLLLHQRVLAALLELLLDAIDIRHR